MSTFCCLTGKQDVIAEVADRLAEIGDQVMITRQHSLPPGIVH